MKEGGALTPAMAVASTAASHHQRPGGAPPPTWHHSQQPHLQPLPWQVLATTSGARPTAPEHGSRYLFHLPRPPTRRIGALSWRRAAAKRAGGRCDAPVSSRLSFVLRLPEHMKASPYPPRQTSKDLIRIMSTGRRKHHTGCGRAVGDKSAVLLDIRWRV